jgi:RNA polymerase sigma-70 factor (ECF subfamily)
VRSGPDDRVAQEELYSMVRAALLLRLETKISPILRPRLDAEDVLHTAFIKALEGLESFHPRHENSFTAWVYRIAKNLIYNAADRRSAGAVRFHHDENGNGLHESQIVADQPGATTALRERDWIEVNLKRLLPREAEVVRLHQLRGKSYEEIAASWKSTPSAVQRLYSRAWRKLGEIAKREEP